MKRAPRFLLVGPFDPTGGEYTFLAPPLGVWCLARVLSNAGFHADIFDPNCCEGAPETALKAVLLTRSWDVVGFSTTGNDPAPRPGAKLQSRRRVERISKSGGCLQP